MQARSNELQQNNLNLLIAEAKRLGASALFVRVSPQVAVFQPFGGSIEVIGRGANYIDYRISF